MTRRLSPLWIFGSLSAALAAGYGVLFTVVGDFRDEYGISETAIGLVIGTGFLSGFVAQVFIAPIADRGRARQIVVIGVAANVAGLLMMGFGESLGPILSGRIISGIGIGAALPAIRRIMILADPGELGQTLGRLMSAEVFGFALGPAVSAALVPSVGLAAPFIVIAALTALIMPLIFLVSANEAQEISTQRLALDLLRSRAVAGAVVLGAALMLMIGAFDALWDVVHEDLGTTTWLSNLGITLFAVPLIILGPTGGRLAQRVGPVRVATAGLLVGALFMFTYGRLPTGSWIFGLTMFHGITDGLTVSASGVAVAMAVPAKRQAGAQGVMGAAQMLVAGVTAISIGALYEGFGRAVAYAAAAIGMVAFTLVGIALAADFWRPDRHLGDTADPAAEAVAVPPIDIARPYS